MEHVNYTAEELARFRRAPQLLGWSWTLKGGAHIKVEIVGRWTPKEAAEVKTILGIIADTITDTAEEWPPALASPPEQKEG